MWSYEIKIELFGHNSTNRVWRKKNDEWGVSIMLWGCLGRLHCIKERMTGAAGLLFPKRIGTFVKKNYVTK